ncbi:hypothetical protein TNCT6_70400 [Streptomyces sp. 6-11-2]|nr:hypothetical protein TNCT6_70400 [Streptomyces sp. 6-11-2]
MFNDEMLTRCEEVMRKVCEDFEAELKEFNGERDHVHLLINYPPKVAVSKLVNSLKGVSAHRIRLGVQGNWAHAHRCSRRARQQCSASGYCSTGEATRRSRPVRGTARQRSTAYATPATPSPSTASAAPASAGDVTPKTRRHRWWWRCSPSA